MKSPKMAVQAGEEGAEPGDCYPYNTKFSYKWLEVTEISLMCTEFDWVQI